MSDVEKIRRSVDVLAVHVSNHELELNRLRCKVEGLVQALQLKDQAIAKLEGELEGRK